MEKHLQEVNLNEVEETGATMVEYALLLALIAVVCIFAVTFLGTSASKKFNEVATAVDSTS